MRSLFYFGKTLFLLLFCLLTGTTEAQQYQNEWINYSLPYYKFKIAQDGLYRINQATLTAVGLGQASAQHFVLWRNGKEVPLYTTQSTGALSTDGYLEFWGEANDGKPDQSLYRTATHQLNEEWSLFTDSASYFLAVDPSVAHLRLMATPNTIPANATPEPYFLYQQGIYFRERINEGYAQVVGSYIYSSAFDSGEGWSSADLYNGQSRSLIFSNLYPYVGTASPAGNLKINFSGNAPNNRMVSVRAGANELSNQSVAQFDAVRWDLPVALTHFSTGELNINVTPQQSVSTDRITIAKLELTYPRRFHFGGASQFEFLLPASSAGRYLEIDGFTHNNQPPVLLDLNNLQRYQTQLDASGKVRVYVGASSIERKLVLFNAASANIVTNLTQRNFVDYTQTGQQGDYLIISNTALATTQSGTNALEQYRAFRSSAEGGSYAARIYFIDQLEDQFAFGIKKHPNSIRNFIRFARNRFTQPLKAVFLIGKGVLYTIDRSLEGNADLNKLSFVPTFGSPASDILLTVDPGVELTPRVAIGRLSVVNAEEILTYLEKIRQTEQVLRDYSSASSTRAWTKNVVHIIGVGEESLGNAITNSMNRFASILREPFYGARIHTFSKLSPAAVAQLSSAQIYSLFEEGIGMMTYFGHSTANTLEYNLDQPSGYNNAGKYPFYIMLGCRAGNLFNFNLTRLIEKETISEQFVLASQRGGIATIASTSLGLVSYLELQNEEMLKAASTSHYGWIVGDIINASLIRTMNSAGAADFLARVHCEQTALNGDPALRFYASSPKPDFLMQAQQLKVEPSPVSVANGFFNLAVTVKNTGKAVQGPVVLSIKRTYADGSSVEWKRDTLVNLYSQDSLLYRIPLSGNKDKGLNRITVCIDPDNNYPELVEDNNCATVSCLVYDDDLRPIYPVPFSIVGKSAFAYSASTANPFASTRSYQFQLDTTAAFNSPLLLTQTIQSVGGLIQFNPSVIYRNNTVYYWRVSPLTSGSPTNWNLSSFLYLAGSQSGYSQSHYFQHLSSESTGMSLDSLSRRWKFGTSLNNLNIRNGVFFTATSALAGFYLGLNGLDLVMYACARNRLVFNVLHPVTLRPIVNAQPGQPGRFGSDPVCVQTAAQAVGAAYNFQFNIADTGVRRRIVGFMDSIPDGYYVVVRNIMETNYPANAYAQDWKNDQQWLGAGQTVYHRLFAQGFTAIDSFNRNRVFAFVYRKNRAQEFTPRFAFSNGLYDQLFFSTDIITQDTLGTVRSPLFGPAKEWQQLNWQGTLETPLKDSVLLRLNGVNQNGALVTILQGIRPPQMQASLASISAQQFPYLQLELQSIDTAYYTPYQLSQWQLLHRAPPEGALAPSQYHYIKDTVEQGEPIVWKMAFRNVSEHSFDSLRAQLVVTNAANQQQQIELPKLRPLPAGDSVQVEVSIPSATNSGTNLLQLEVNPQPGQVEQFYFNNSAYKNVYVRPDQVAPLLDVTIDGRHITNGETVLNYPDIRMTLHDDSKWLPLNDTSLLSVWLRYPSGQLRRFYYTNDTLRFFASTIAVLPNKAVAQLRPHLTETGFYELVVAAKDRAGNKAGALDYRITFKVAAPSPRFDLVFYPNPFSSTTKIAYNLWGNSIPSDVQLQIFNEAGQMVRQVSAQELGQLRLGRNVSLFEWNGKDAAGHALSSGTYICRLVSVGSSDENLPYVKKGSLLVLAQGKIILHR